MCAGGCKERRRGTTKPIYDILPVHTHTHAQSPSTMDWLSWGKLHASSTAEVVVEANLIITIIT